MIIDEVTEIYSYIHPNEKMSCESWRYVLDVTSIAIGPTGNLILLTH